MRWFTSDLHFNHKNIIKYQRPQFNIYNTIDKNLDLMNRTIINNINMCVKRNDELWILGDISLSSDMSYLKEINCNNIIVVAGNHDYFHSMHFSHGKRSEQIEKHKQVVEKFMQKTGVKEVYETSYLNLEGIRVRISHFPYKDDKYGETTTAKQWRPKDDGMWLICGHVHDKWRQFNNQINVGIDAWAGMPVSEHQIINHISGGEKFISLLPINLSIHYNQYYE